MKIIKTYVFPIMLLILLSAGSFALGAGSYTLDYTLRNFSNTALDENPSADAPDVIANNEKITVPPVSDSDHILGNKDAKIAFIEYSDLECPFCKNFHQTMKDVINDNPEDFVWVFRHFPLSIHQGAEPKAKYSECVATVGGNEKFWEFIDLLYNNLTSKEEELLNMAVSLDLDEEELKKCLASEGAQQAVAEDVTSGNVAGITGTPGTIILHSETKKTVLIPGALDYTQVLNLVEQVK